ncbi:hypothetical protein [Fibrobacter sp.]|uniref:hypothetical protein n=1 Tax=Fibrobacter sp. TaxID=35828 RepID=UPI001B06773C|nr:hypothetical protein [Fibrobacter sp.]MBO7061268.1 hypothetical protein [Fibrobacter sp.]MBO7105084.1 hypothetical protein [Fibrobacter sp.]MBR3670036.1 hypothetical protein [Fibrobacter sp.]
MLSVIIVIAIIVLSLILAAIGAYVVVHNSDEKEEAKPIIDVSGQYSAVVRPAKECLTAVKPSEASLRSWLETQDLTPEAREELIRQWNESMEETIRTINEGDANGTATYRIEIGPKGKNYCKFVDEDNFITREQIRHHAEILPPYVLGCDCRLMPRHPWETQNKADWKAVIPTHGNSYDVPDWRQLA